MTERTAAAVFLNDADQWTPEGRDLIAAWLREQADKLNSLGVDYDSSFKALYFARQ
ncbi:MAG: hypothetical protein H0T60_13750 [Acidobacteria bacterium]|nr:hypothetical protein [Acidobacteriota bacterium]